VDVVWSAEGTVGELALDSGAAIGTSDGTDGGGATSVSSGIETDGAEVGSPFGAATLSSREKREGGVASPPELLPTELSGLIAFCTSACLSANRATIASAVGSGLASMNCSGRKTASSIVPS
jgi:hypothetical protein